MEQKDLDLPVDGVVGIAQRYFPSHLNVIGHAVVVKRESLGNNTSVGTLSGQRIVLDTDQPVYSQRIALLNQVMALLLTAAGYEPEEYDDILTLLANQLPVVLFDNPKFTEMISSFDPDFIVLGDGDKPSVCCGCGDVSPTGTPTCNC